MPLLALFRLAFASPPAVTALSLRHQLTCWLILQKARCQIFILQPVVNTRFQILFHSPRRGSFHLSLTVLLHYRSPSVFRLGRWTAQFRTGLACPVLLRILLTRLDYVYGVITLFDRPSQTFPLRLNSLVGVLQPRCTSTSVWPFPLSLATTRRILSFPRAT